jgi:hypothetical protein
MAKHVCPNRFAGEGARGGCYFEIEPAYGQKEDVVSLNVGWSCVVVHSSDVPVTWLSEIVAIATGHEGGIAGFLAHHNYGGGYALQCNPGPALTSNNHEGSANVQD